VEQDPSRTVQAARRRIHRVKRSTGRVLVAGLGFSAAYFFDPAQGRARRAKYVGMVRRMSGRREAATTELPEPDVPKIGRADLGHRATFQRAADGVGTGARP
jgi:hypothetical protein